MRRIVIAATLSSALLFAACGGGEAATTTAAAPEAPGVTLVSPRQAADVVAAAPDGLVVLDVRTAKEWEQFRLADSILVDIYEDDFADRIAELERNVPYVLYCNSGNRSAAASSLMRDLGFGEVYEIDGGIQAWLADGLPTIP